LVPVLRAPGHSCETGHDNVRNSLAGASVTVWVGGAGSTVRRQRLQAPGDEFSGVGPHEFGYARIDALWSFRDLSEHQDGCTEGGCLLLDTTRVGQDEAGRPERRNEVEVVEGLGKMNARVTGKKLAGRLQNVRVRVDRVDDLDVFDLVGERANASEELPYRCTKGLSSMSGKKD
jgi:hypothetical protein